jgi:hypothetical protein
VARREAILSTALVAAAAAASSFPVLPAFAEEVSCSLCDSGIAFSPRPLGAWAETWLEPEAEMSAFMPDHTPEFAPRFILLSSRFMTASPAQFEAPERTSRPFASESAEPTLERPGEGGRRRQAQSSAYKDEVDGWSMEVPASWEVGLGGAQGAVGTRRVVAFFPKGDDLQTNVTVVITNLAADYTSCAPHGPMPCPHDHVEAIQLKSKAIDHCKQPGIVTSILEAGIESPPVSAMQTLGMACGGRH